MWDRIKYLVYTRFRVLIPSSASLLLRCSTPCSAGGMRNRVYAIGVSVLIKVGKSTTFMYLSKSTQKNCA